jgi:ribosomal protein L11 methyltransferase
MAQWLLDSKLQGKSVLDMGCGTGILAIIAAKKGATRVVAIDNHPFAVENSQENVVRNKVGFIEVIEGDATLLGQENFDVIIANITKNILMADMERYTSVLNPGGLLFLSGFLEKDVEDLVNHALNFGMTFHGSKKQNDWMAILLKKESGT